MEVAVFFDFRPVWGDDALADDLRSAVLAAVRLRPVFGLQLAQEILSFRVPLGLFGGIRADDGHQGTLDLKVAMLPYTGFARVEALLHGIAVTGTAARLRALAHAGFLPKDLVDEILAAWRFMMGLRLATRTGDGRDDRLDPAGLADWDAALLKRSLGVITSFQHRLRLDCERSG
jgi:CBS domain-containing protein